MKIILTLLLSVTYCFGANKTAIGRSDFKTTKGSADQQTLLFAQITNNIPFTVACWVKYDWTDAGVDSQLGAGAKQGLVSKGLFEQSGANGNLQLGLSSVSEKIGFSYANPNGTYHIWRTTANSVQTNTWMHLAVTYTYATAGSLVFYINGESQAGTWGTGTGNAVAITNATSFHTFLYQQNGVSSFFGGAMSDLAIWTNALSAGEILKLAKSKVKYMPMQIRATNLVFYWPMDTGIAMGAVGAGGNIDIDRTQQHFNMDAGGVFVGERTLSYYPNE